MRGIVLRHPGLSTPKMLHEGHTVHGAVRKLQGPQMLPVPMDSPVAFDSSRLNNEANDCH